MYGNVTLYGRIYSCVEILYYNIVILGANICRELRQPVFHFQASLNPRNKAILLSAMKGIH